MVHDEKEHVRTHSATLRACKISRSICWLFPIKQDIAKLAKPKTVKYVEEQLWFWFLVLDTR